MVYLFQYGTEQIFRAVYGYNYRNARSRVGDTWKFYSRMAVENLDVTFEATAVTQLPEVQKYRATQ